MRTSEERIEELHRRIALRRQEKTDRRYRAVAASSVAAMLALTLLIAQSLSNLSARVPGAATGAFTASIFSDHAALGFVVAALAAFCLGSLGTVLCYRLRNRKDYGERSDD